MRVHDDFYGNVAFVRRGMGFYVVCGDNVLWSREVWTRPVWFRWNLRPYESRVARAKRKAEKVAAAFNDPPLGCLGGTA